jgi:hypothetical protein
MPLRVTNSNVSNNSITITFSGPVDLGSNILGNYTVFDPGSVDFSQPQALAVPVAAFGTPSGNGLLVTINFTPSTGIGTNEFQNGDWVHVTVTGLTSTVSGVTETLEGGRVSFARQVPGGGTDFRRATRDVEDAVTYPVLTESVSFPRSGGGPTTGASSSQGGGSLGQTAALAIGDVLGWKVSATDPKGFVGALTQAFTLTEVEGRVESSWNPRTFAVQTDLGGGITGAQASLYTRAKDALDQSLQLLDGLYPLDPEADPEYVKALREMARSQMTEIVKEFGAVGLPSILRIDTYFDILLGQHPSRSAPVQFDPDQIGGTLGEVRDTYGIQFRGNPFNNSIEDEQDITNFRVISDYMTSLMQSWIANREFFIVSPNRIAFFGTQLVLISRQLNVIAETVDEVRFALDSVFIGPNERQALLLKFRDHDFPPMFLEDVLEEIEKFVEDEGPRLLRDGGKIAVTNNILPVVRALKSMIEQARDPENRRQLPDGFSTARVRHSLDDLRDQLGELIKLTTQVEQQVPAPEDKLIISGISTPINDPTNNWWVFSIYGDGFDPLVIVTINSTTPVAPYVTFYSDQRIDVTIDPTTWGELTGSSHDITVTNSDCESATLHNAFIIGQGGAVSSPVIEAGTVVVRGTGATVAGGRAAVKSPGASGAAMAPVMLASPQAAVTATQMAVLQKQISDLKTAQDAALQKQIGELKADQQAAFRRLEEKLSDMLEAGSKKNKRKS